MASPVRIAQVVGITTSAYLAGANTSLSFLSIPPLLLAPAPLAARQWRKMFEHGKTGAPPLALLSALSFSYLSYRFYGTLNHAKAELYAVCSILGIAIVPYTFIFMSKVNDKLSSKAEEAKALSLEKMSAEVAAPKGESTNELLDLWASHNFARGLFPLASSVLGLWTSLSFKASG